MGTDQPRAGDHEFQGVEEERRRCEVSASEWFLRQRRYIPMRARERTLGNNRDLQSGGSASPNRVKNPERPNPGGASRPWALGYNAFGVKDTQANSGFSKCAARPRVLGYDAFGGVNEGDIQEWHSVKRNAHHENTKVRKRIRFEKPRLPGRFLFRVLVLSCFRDENRPYLTCHSGHSTFRGSSPAAIASRRREMLNVAFFVPLHRAGRRGKF